MTGIVFDIQRFALYDGPGIRTTVFLKGCPLRCAWCHNPESWEFHPQEVVNSDGSIKVYGKEMSVQTALSEVVADRPYYERSGGGVTFSGGEPLAQFDFCLELLKESKKLGLHTCLDTSGHVPTDRLLKTLPYVDIYLYDYKGTDSKLHKDLTGVGNELILKNLELLYKEEANITLRCPLIPGINDQQKHLAGIAALSERYPNLMGVEIMAYHNMGNSKAQGLGIDKLLTGLSNASEEIKETWIQELHRLGCNKAKIG